MPFSTIAVKLRLIMLKITKKKVDQKNLLANFIFLKVVISNIRDAFGANHYIKLILLIYSIKKKSFLTFID